MKLIQSLLKEWRMTRARWITENSTVGEMAKVLYNGITYDTALPQMWVDVACQYGFDPRGHFVWLYPERDIAGYPAPITDEGIVMLAKLASRTVTALHSNYNTLQPRQG